MHCPHCGRVNDEQRQVCEGCQRELGPSSTAKKEALPKRVTPRFFELRRQSIIILALGLGLAVFAQLFWIGSYITWFLGSLFHEIGHCAIGLSMGMPSFPVISLGGHAAAVSTQQIFLLFLLMLGVHAAFVWRMRGVSYWRWFFASLLFLHVICGFYDGPRNLVYLYAGQCGEVLFAAVFIFRAWTGGFTETPAERPLYAALAWVFLFENIGLAFGLLFSEEARRTYAGSGSFGLTNDLLRVSQELGISLQSAALPLLCFSFLMPLVTVAMCHSYTLFMSERSDRLVVV